MSQNANNAFWTGAKKPDSYFLMVGRLRVGESVVRLCLRKEVGVCELLMGGLRVYLRKVYRRIVEVMKRSIRTLMIARIINGGVESELIAIFAIWGEVLISHATWFGVC